jgi:sulfate adenylyltransferase subunit 1
MKNSALERAAVEDSQPVDRGVLRFFTAGSVDDGKSTLIGRLLLDSKGLFADQLASLERASKRRGFAEAPLDLSLLTDGLEAEREQGITIDVAYRYFATPQRKFIIADCPGHEQYTRNMVTGASTSDAAIILVDATKIHDKLQGADDLLPQTKRHAAIAQLMALKHVAFAVNKLDAIGYDEAAYQRIAAALREMADKLGFAHYAVFPVAALPGDNVAHRSTNMPWYAGPTLLEWLEGLDTELDAECRPLRFPVQWVGRGEAQRRYAGRLESGSVKPGQRLLALPSEQEVEVVAVQAFDRNLDQAYAGQSVAIVLDREIDLSRGDMLVDPATRPPLVREARADLCWLDNEPLNPQRRYIAKHTTRTTLAKVSSIDNRLNIKTLVRESDGSAGLKTNDIAEVRVQFAQPIAADAYRDNPLTGAFILIDEGNNRTVAAGMIRDTSL